MARKGTISRRQRLERFNRQQKGNQVTQQPQTIPLPPMITTGNVWLAAQAILAVSFAEYVHGEDDRTVVIFLVGPHTLDLVGSDADAFKAWWDQVTGTARIQPAPPGLKLS